MTCHDYAIYYYLLLLTQYFFGLLVYLMITDVLQNNKGFKWPHSYCVTPFCVDTLMRKWIMRSQLSVRLVVIPARSLQAFTATPSKNHGHLGTFHSHQLFFHSHIHNHISGFMSCHFFIVYPHRSCCCWRLCRWGCGFSCWCPLLKAGVPVAAGLLVVANIVAVACFPAVSGVS